MDDDDVDLYADLGGTEPTDETVAGDPDDLYADILGPDAADSATPARISSKSSSITATTGAAKAAPAPPPPLSAAGPAVSSVGALLPTPKPTDDRPADPLAHEPLLASFRPSSTQAAIFVGNFGWWTQDAELLALCSSVGAVDVTRVCIVTDPGTGCSKGFGVIEVGSETSAQKLFDELPKQEAFVPGQSLVVELATKSSLADFAQRIGKELPPVGGGATATRRRERLPPPPAAVGNRASWRGAVPGIRPGPPPVVQSPFFGGAPGHFGGQAFSPFGGVAPGGMWPSGSMPPGAMMSAPFPAQWGPAVGVAGWGGGPAQVSDGRDADGAGDGEDEDRRSKRRRRDDDSRGSSRRSERSRDRDRTRDRDRDRDRRGRSPRDRDRDRDRDHSRAKER
mmetsp:Transcript_28290/g.74217  ORF Transcript_28290/g.74217 Transcript_28290/m.74217 type:complete len:395 (+) Transcript_28290:59-1243(+)